MYSSAAGVDALLERRMQFRVVLVFRPLDKPQDPPGYIALRDLGDADAGPMPHQLMRDAAGDAVKEQRVVGVLQHGTVPGLHDVAEVARGVGIVGALRAKACIADLPGGLAKLRAGRQGRRVVEILGKVEIRRKAVQKICHARQMRPAAGPAS